MKAPLLIQTFLSFVISSITSTGQQQETNTPQSHPSHQGRHFPKFSLRYLAELWSRIINTVREVKLKRAVIKRIIECGKASDGDAREFIESLGKEFEGLAKELEEEPGLAGFMILRKDECSELAQRHCNSDKNADREKRTMRDRAVDCFRLVLLNDQTVSLSKLLSEILRKSNDKQKRQIALVIAKCGNRKHPNWLRDIYSAVFYKLIKSGIKSVTNTFEKILASQNRNSWLNLIGDRDSFDKTHELEFFKRVYAGLPKDWKVEGRCESPTPKKLKASHKNYYGF
jgi:hypothetical protein